MINQFEVPMYLEDELPEITKDLKKIKNPANAYQSVHVLLDYTFSKIKEHKLDVVKKCFALAEKLFDKGNQIVRCAVENIFVFSFSNLPVKTSTERKAILGMIPGTLYSLYITQVMHHGT
jgi:hypothetical protein